MTAIRSYFPPRRKAEFDEEDLRRLLVGALRDWRFDELCLDAKLDHPGGRLTSVVTEASRAVILWSLLTIAYVVASLFDVGVAAYATATVVVLPFARRLAPARTSRRTGLEGFWPFDDVSPAQLLAVPLWSLAMLCGLGVLIFGGLDQVVVTLGWATIVATAIAALYAAGRTVRNLLKGRAPRLESGMALVVPIAFLVLFGLLLSAELWTVADNLRWWPGILIAPLALGPLVFFLFRQLRGSIEAAFTKNGKDLVEANEAGAVQEVLKLLGPHGRKVESSERLKHLLECAFRTETIEGRAAAIGHVMKRSFTRPLLVGLVPVVLGVAALMTTFMYLLAWIAIDVTVAGGWLAPSDTSPPAVATETPLNIPWGPYPIVAALLGIVAAAVFLAYALTDAMYRVPLTNSAIDIPARRCLLLGIPYRYLAAKHDHWDEALPLPPDRDDLTDDNTFATCDQHDAGHAEHGAGHSLWYRWVAQADMGFRVAARSDSFSPLVAIYSAADGAEPLAITTYHDRPARFVAVEGTEYRIAVDGRKSVNGNTCGPFTLGWGPAPAPANDDWRDAVELPGPRGDVEGTTRYASREDDEPLHAGETGGASVWYRWTASDDAWLSLKATSDEIRPLVALYVPSATGTLEAVPVHGRDDSTSLTFAAIAGTEYLVAIDAPDGAWGGFRLSWEPAPAPPANDAFATARRISDQRGRVEGDNTHATREDGEPAHAGRAGGRSVWYRWKAPASESFTFTTAGSSFDTLLAVYAGDAVNRLTLVAANDDAGHDRTSLVRFDAIEGRDYRLAVDGFLGATGAFVLAWEPGPPRPANDDFAAAIAITEMTGSIRGTSEYATKEPDEPWHAGSRGGRSVWYRWKAPSDGWVRFQTHGSSFDTLLAVYTGDVLDRLSLVAENDDASPTPGPSRVRFAATGGREYHVAVDGWLGSGGEVTLEWRALTRFEVAWREGLARLRGLTRRL